MRLAARCHTWLAFKMLDATSSPFAIAYIPAAKALPHVWPAGKFCANRACSVCRLRQRLVLCTFARAQQRDRVEKQTHRHDSTFKQQCQRLQLEQYLTHVEWLTGVPLHVHPCYCFQWVVRGAGASKTCFSTQHRKHSALERKRGRR